MQEWMGTLTALNRIASYLEIQATAWLDLLRGMYTHEANPILLSIRKDIATAIKAKQISPDVRQELGAAMNSPFTFEEFEHCRRHLTAGKSPGPSGIITTTQSSQTLGT